MGITTCGTCRLWLFDGVALLGEGTVDGRTWRLPHGPASEYRPRAPRAEDVASVACCGRGSRAVDVGRNMPMACCVSRLGARGRGSERGVGWCSSGKRGKCACADCVDVGDPAKTTTLEWKQTGEGGDGSTLVALLGTVPFEAATFATQSLPSPRATLLSADAVRRLTTSGTLPLACLSRPAVAGRERGGGASNARRSMKALPMGAAPAFVYTRRVSVGEEAEGEAACSPAGCPCRGAGCRAPARACPWRQRHLRRRGRLGAW